MDIKNCKGVIPPVVVPLDREAPARPGSALARSIDRMIDAGVDGLFFLGSSGEVAFLTDAQRYHVLQEAVAMVHGRVPVLAGHHRHGDAARCRPGQARQGIRRRRPGGHRALLRAGRPQGGRAPLPRHPGEHRPAAVRLRPCRCACTPSSTPRCSCAWAPTACIQGVKDSSGDDVSFRWLCIENEEAGHPLQLLTGHEVVRRRRLHGRRRRQRARPGQHRPRAATWSSGAPTRPATGRRSATLQDHLARLMFVTRKVKATVGFGAGVGAFKTALWQMGVFNTNQMREPVQPLKGDDVEAIVEVLKAEGMMPADQPIRRWSSAGLGVAAP